MKGHLIVVIVDKNSEEVVMKKLQSMKIETGIVLIGRGTGDPIELSFLGLKIEPEKRVFLVVTKPDETNAIMDKLTERLNLTEVNKGIAFSMPIKKAIGLEE